MISLILILVGSAGKTYIYIYIYIYIHIYVCVWVCVCVCLFVFTYLCVFDFFKKEIISFISQSTFWVWLLLSRLTSTLKVLVDMKQGIYKLFEQVFTQLGLLWFIRPANKNSRIYLFVLYDMQFRFG